MTETWTTGRLVLLGAGVVLVGVGVVVGLTSVPQGQWPSVLLWLAGGVAVHDAVLAPAAVVLGALVLPRVPVGWRPALRAGALGAAVLAIFAVVIVVASGMRRDPSVVPVPLTTSLVVATAVLVLAVLVGAAVGTARDRPRAPEPVDPDLLPREDAD
ncbi:hypothetical protein [Cellulomonas humilata]|uniref:Uncharacterized protein (DUF983 family) n=1 Tax=Cellulomonas humilata TaxID=144055 RepID=A0ABU0EH83_9CELL|nr:hypothetical protein [Cellulomonas humilata]MDQ0374625.1 uncharacterized protein (DUF983 family) [Cellulomonas humilata]